MDSTVLLILGIIFTAAGYFCAGMCWERQYGCWRKEYFKQVRGSEPCCGDWDNCQRPCTPRGEKIAERCDGDKTALIAALRKCVVAFSEMEPKPQDYQSVSDAANLLERLGK